MWILFTNQATGYKTKTKQQFLPTAARCSYAGVQSVLKVGNIVSKHLVSQMET